MNPEERAEALRKATDYDACDFSTFDFVKATRQAISALAEAERERDEAREQHRKARALAHSYWLELALIKNHGSDDAKVLKARAKAALEEP